MYYRENARNFMTRNTCLGIVFIIFHRSQALCLYRYSSAVQIYEFSYICSCELLPAPIGLRAQLVEYCTDVAVMGSDPVQA